MKTLFGPCIIVFLLLLYFIFNMVSKCIKKLNMYSASFRASLVRAFLLAVLLSYQQIVSGLFTLVQCVDIAEDKVLYIGGYVECFTWWQETIQIYICVSIVPVFVILSHASFHIVEKKMPIEVFFLVCLFPLPAILMYHLIRLVKGNRRKGPDTFGISEVKSEKTDKRRSVHTLGIVYILSDSDTDIGSEYSNDIERRDTVNIASGLTPERRDEVQEATEPHDDKEEDEKSCMKESQSTQVDGWSDSRYEIVHTLLEHYKPLSLCGFRFTWLAVHKLYRIMLVACNTFIMDPLLKLLIMTAVLILVALLNTMVRPYKHKNANYIASISYTANLVFAMLSLCKVVLEKFGCQTNCQFQVTFLNYLKVCENILLVYVPVGAVFICAVYALVQKCRGKEKSE